MRRGATRWPGSREVWWPGDEEVRELRISWPSGVAGFPKQYPHAARRLAPRALVAGSSRVLAWSLASGGGAGELLGLPALFFFFLLDTKVFTNLFLLVFFLILDAKIFL